ncbi:MAG: hypothetical protein FWD25_03000 [Clostridia bacterium]|nr:hypothetical protein [Clostridia bacterium]
MQINMQKKRGVHRALYISLAVFVLAVVVIVTMVGQMSLRVDAEQTARLREVLHRAAISCYAVEGRYPPSLEYLVEHYSVVIDYGRFIVNFDVISPNTMPMIEVIWVEGAVG